MAIVGGISTAVLLVLESIIVIAREGEEGDKLECDGLGSDSERAILEIGRGLVFACCLVCPLGESFVIDEVDVVSDEDCTEDFKRDMVGSD